MSEAVPELLHMSSWRAQGRLYLLPSYYLCHTLNAHYHFASWTHARRHFSTLVSRDKMSAAKVGTCCHLARYGSTRMGLGG